MPQPKHITTVKTARYYTLGTVTPATKNIWLVLHGYAMNGEDFAKQFQQFANEGDYIIAPEALSRFYTKGFFGPVGASWMTKEDRESEITDYTAYLNHVYVAEIMPHLNKGITIHLLGFSQGSTTMCRYISYAPNYFDYLWVCAGDIPDDMNWDNFNRLLQTGKLHIIVGTQDPLIPQDRFEQLYQRMKERNVAYELHTFDGMHEIDFGVLEKYRSR
jgi:predicted esterase